MTASGRSLPSKRSTSEPESLAVLQAENERLIGLLEANGIDWRLAPEPATSPSKPESSRLSTEAKVALFRRQFRGRTDVYPPLEDDSCYFLAIDFDEAEWREDVRAFAGSCTDLGVPVAIETSRSGNGAHAWIFFADRVPARDARRLGTAIVSHTCARTRQLELSSYDRLFPNQDTMPKGGFGNLIALPLQKKPRENSFTVFVDSDLRPHPDQWEFLASIQPMSPHDIEPTAGA